MPGNRLSTRRGNARLPPVCKKPPPPLILILNIDYAINCTIHGLHTGLINMTYRQVTNSWDGGDGYFRGTTRCDEPTQLWTQTLISQITGCAGKAVNLIWNHPLHPHPWTASEGYNFGDDPPLHPASIECTAYT